MTRPTRKYTVLLVHKISNPCKCAHDCPDHANVDGKIFNGPCKHYGCECRAYAPRDVAEYALPSEVMDAVPPNPKTVAHALREARILPRGARLAMVRREGAKLTCIPQASALHALIIELAPSELAPMVALRTEAARVGWPTSFVTDLAHDALVVATMQPHEPFSWCLRSDGTHIGRAVLPDERGRALTMRMVADAFGAPLCRFYVWDGVALQPCDTAEAADSRLAVLAGRRFMVKTRRSSSLVPAALSTALAASTLAANWGMHYGEDFVTVDTWQ
jgi:hypothetical protein